MSTFEKSLQQELLSTLKEIDRVCKKNSINYSLHGGTMLGAVRNGSFIPWDDDLDISMTRDNFVHFIKVCENSGTLVVTHSKVAGWVPRVIMVGKTCAIDVFVYDYICKNKTGRLFKISLLIFAQGLFKDKLSISQYNNFLKKTCVYFSSMIGSYLTYNQKMKFYTQIATNVFIGQKVFVHRAVDSMSALFLVIPEQWVSSYTEICFEGSFFQIHKGYTQILESIYGADYMTPLKKNETDQSHEHIRKNLIN